MPQLSQPSPPPGIPPGIAPHRRPAAKAGSDFTEVKGKQTNIPEGNEPCKFFAQGSCFRGDSCYYAHVAPADSATTPVPSEDFISRRTHDGHVETPPVWPPHQVLHLCKLSHSVYHLFVNKVLVHVTAKIAAD